MGCQEKFCYIRTCGVQKHYYGVVLHKLLYTRRDRSRRIRDEATACEPEVVTCKRGNSGQTGSRNMAATRFLDSATQTSYLTSITSVCLSRTVTEF